MKQISKSLLSYVRECGRNLPQGPGWGDIKLIAVGDSTSETIRAGLEQNGSAKKYTDYTVQLLKLVLIAVVSSPDNENFVRTLQDLSETSQKSVKRIIEDVLVPIVYLLDANADCFRSWKMIILNLP